jgi:uncharacterized membrane protein YbhN (UPF0104 family)
VTRVPRGWRLLLVVPVLVAAGALIWWRGPDWGVVRDAFTVVRWRWVVAAVGLNLLSVLTRSVAWDTAIRQAMPPPHPRFPLVFSAFSVGLFANAVLPGRVGELARVAVLTRRMPGRRGAGVTLIGSVFAHRVFDLFPALTLVVWVLLAAKVPHWAITSLLVVIAIGSGLFAFALVSARRSHDVIDGLGSVRKLLARARTGLAVMRAPLPALFAGTFQFLGWACQLLAVYTAMRAFHIHEPLAAAGLVLVLMNVATIFPLWPGNVGLVQAAVALPLVQYGVAYARGFAFGIGLQAIEASVGVGVGLLFLAREGLSYATLKQMPEATASDVGPHGDAAEDTERARAGVSG